MLWMQGHPGWSRWGVQTCPKTAAHCHDTVSLWLGRMRYVSKLVDLGYNPLYLDTDFTVQDNFYKYLRTPLMEKQALLFMREGEVQPFFPGDKAVILGTQFKVYLLSTGLPAALHSWPGIVELIKLRPRFSISGHCLR